MKKIITLIVIVFTFSLNVNAQEAKTASELGKEDAINLVNFLQADSSLINDLQSLFTMKHETLLTEGISEERKQVLSEVIVHKLVATLGTDEIEKLKTDPELYKKLILN